MKAMIFAAGFGKRLYPITQNLPKALVPVQNKPMLQWVSQYLTQWGVNEILMNTHYLPEKIEEYLKTYSLPCKVRTTFEPTILGTGEGLYVTQNFWGDDSFLVCNVDILCNANLQKLMAFHRDSKCVATLAVNERISTSMLLIDERGRLCGIKRSGKEEFYTQYEGEIREVGFCGIHAISPELFTLTDPHAPFSIIDLYLQLINKGATILTWPINDSYWEDIGSPEVLAKANKEFPGLSRPTY